MGHTLSLMKASVGPSNPVNFSPAQLNQALTSLMIHACY